MPRAILVTALLILAAIPASPAEQATPGQQWIREMLSEDPACDPETIETIARSTRRGIEREVGRRENSVKPPAAAGELSCLGDLMQSNLDIAFPTQRLTSGLPGFLQGILSQVLAGSGLSLGSIDVNQLASGLAAGGSDPTRILSSSLCDFAQSRWSQATLPSLGGFADFGPLAILPLLTGTGAQVTNFPQPDLRRPGAPPASPGSPGSVLGIN